MNHSHIGRARLLSSRGGPYHVRLASYTWPDPGAPREGCSQLTAVYPLRRFQQTPLKSTGSPCSLSPLWFDSCPRSGGLTTEDTEKEGLGDGADVHRSKPQAICATGGVLLYHRVSGRLRRATSRSTPVPPKARQAWRPAIQQVWKPALHRAAPGMPVSLTVSMAVRR